jgi:hypothetical protein
VLNKPDTVIIDEIDKITAHFCFDDRIGHVYDIDRDSTGASGRQTRLTGRGRQVTGINL